MTRAWRILKRRCAADGLTGQGAMLHGSRWTSPGRPAVFFAQSLALAALEILTGIKGPQLLRQAYVRFGIGFEESAVETLHAEALPQDWRRPGHPALPALGDAWLLEGRCLLLKVPSAVVAGEWNYILNPHHPDRARLAVSPVEGFDFDPRLTELGVKRP